MLAFKHRYDLNAIDLGITRHDSFVLKVLEEGSTAKRLEELSSKQSQYLGSWIQSLFVAEGISDETMSSCSPQDFYLIVSTLFRQSLAACEAGKLEFDPMKEGFSLLLEPFLLPALVFALTWMSKHIMVSDTDSSIVLRLLNALVKPSSISGEAKQTHATILAIVAVPLDRELRRFPKNRQDIKHILAALEPHLTFRRTGTSTRVELESWTTVPSGGMLAALKSTLSNLVNWSTNPSTNLSHHAYTHRQILSTLEIRGAQSILATLVSELKTHFSTGHGDLALDIVANLIASPTPESTALLNPLIKHKYSNRRQLSLLSALNLALCHLTDPLSAELIARLHRRVQALNHMPIPIPAPAPTLMSDISMMGGLGLDVDGSKVGESGAAGIVESAADAAATTDAVKDAETAAIDEMIAEAGEIGSTVVPVVPGTVVTAGDDVLGVGAGVGAMGAGLGLGTTDDDLLIGLGADDELDLTGMGNGDQFLELDMDAFDY